MILLNKPGTQNENKSNLVAKKCDISLELLSFHVRLRALNLLGLLWTFCLSLN